MAPRHHCTMVPRHHGTTTPWHYGTTVPQHPGTTVRLKTPSKDSFWLLFCFCLIPSFFVDFSIKTPHLLWNTGIILVSSYFKTAMRLFVSRVSSTLVFGDWEFSNWQIYPIGWRALHWYTHANVSKFSKISYPSNQKSKRRIHFDFRVELKSFHVLCDALYAVTVLI